MRDFLSGKTFHSRLFSAMIPDVQTWTLEDLKVSEHSYRLEPEALSSAFGVVLPISTLTPH